MGFTEIRDKNVVICPTVQNLEHFLCHDGCISSHISESMDYCAHVAVMMKVFLVFVT